MNVLLLLLLLPQALLPCGMRVDDVPSTQLEAPATHGTTPRMPCCKMQGPVLCICAAMCGRNK
jgi:hypothetical protein